jgi:bifunctional non-homologous end joining protein LigD
VAGPRRSSNCSAATACEGALDLIRLYVLAKGDKDIRQLPLIERKQVLRDSFGDTAVLIYVSGIVEAGAWVFEQVKAHDLEGMLAKRLDSTYQRGRSRDWLKIKNPDYSRPAALGFGHKRS